MLPMTATWGVVIGLGSNLGPRLEHLRAAAAALERLRGLSVLKRSSVIETPPAGGPRQPAYLNAAVLAECELAPTDLLAQTQQLEVELGRVRPDPVRWGPRTIDIDLLWSPGVVLELPTLILPHPRLRERVFALGPLLELVPDAADPHGGKSYAKLTSGCWLPRVLAQL